MKMMDELHMEEERLVSRVHKLEDEMHAKDTGCMTPEIAHLRQEVIDTVEKIDELHEKMGEPIKKEY